MKMKTLAFTVRRTHVHLKSIHINNRDASRSCLFNGVVCSTFLTAIIIGYEI